MSGADGSIGAKERLHPLFLITGLGPRLRRAVGGFAAVGYLAATGSLQTALLIFAGVAMITVVGVFVYWRHFEFSVGLHEIRIHSGILSRTHRSIAYDRIQDVGISQGPVARLLGIAAVRFETGGSAGDQDDDGALAAVSLARAESLRELIRSRRGAGPIVEEARRPADAETRPIYAMDLRRLLIAGTLNFSLAVLAGLAGATQTIGDAAGFDIFARRFWRKTLEAGSPIADLVLAHQVIAVAIGAVTLVVLGLATGLTRTILREYGFRLDRAANGLRRRRGLLTITDVTLPIARVQAAIIGSGPVRERYGWSDLKLQSLAKDEGSSGDHVVAPLAREDELAIVLRELGWRAFDPPPAWMRTPAAYALSLTIGLAPLLGLFVAASAIDLRISAAGCLILVALITTRWLAWRRFRYALEDDRLLIRSGWWKRRLIILPLSSIQSADLTESVFSRWFGVAALTFGVASGRGFSRHGIPALDRQVARTLRDRVMRPRPS